MVEKQKKRTFGYDKAYTIKTGYTIDGKFSFRYLELSFTHTHIRLLKVKAEEVLC